VAAIFAQALARRRSEEKLRSALVEIGTLRDRLALENVQLRSEVRSLLAPAAIAAESAAVKRVLAQVEQVASTSATVLLLGETGSGKEVFAQAIHDASERRGRPMVRVNCAAIPAPLLESELFGRERGAYTGALSRQIGRFEMAEGSTLFLDEIGELPADAQVKLLRVLQDRVVERLGSGRPIQVDVRIIAATNRDLERAVAEGHIRKDLYYRLNVFPITVPPLRERLEDIPVLVWSFVAEFAKSFNKPIESISKDDLDALGRYPWPGNVRELRNLVERAVIVANGKHLMIPTPEQTALAARGNLTLSALEVEHIREIVEKAGWRVRGPGGAAELLGMKPTTLDSRMAKLGIRRPTPGR
jgi:transcriptional regulator with GAF, ATPase, and Fis domain